jgi:hypothetical protein
VWKRFGSGKPQQRAAAMCDPPLAERAERQAAVDRSTCSRLTSRRSPVRAGHRPFSRARVPSCASATNTHDKSRPTGLLRRGRGTAVTATYRGSCEGSRTAPRRRCRRTRRQGRLRPRHESAPDTSRASSAKGAVGATLTRCGVARLPRPRWRWPSPRLLLLRCPRRRRRGRSGWALEPRSRQRSTAPAPEIRCSCGRVPTASAGGVAPVAGVRGALS